MVRFAIIEVNQNLTIAQVAPGQLPEDTARQERGYLIDPDTYRSYDQAREALFKIQPKSTASMDQTALPV